MVFWIKAVEKYQSVRTEAWNIIFYGCRASVINEKIVTLSHFFLSNGCVEITTLFWTTMWRNYPYNNTMIIILQTTTYFRIQRMEQNIRRRMVWLFENTLCYILFKPWSNDFGLAYIKMNHILSVMKRLLSPLWSLLLSKV